MRLSITKLGHAKSVYHLLRHGVIGEEVNVQGWIRHFRNHKNASFLQLSDGLSACSLQVVLPKSAPSHFNVGAAVEVRGILQRSEGRGQELDLAASEVVLVGDIERLSYPFATKKKQLPATLRQYPHLRPKTSNFGAFLRIRSKMKYALHRYFQDKGFVLIECPVITSNDCEAAGETFLVDASLRSMSESGGSTVEGCKTNPDNFFGHSVYLTVSSQLHLEATACGLKQVYAFGPAFRAESSLTRQHLAEFQMLEVELAFCNELETLLQLVEDVVLFCARELLTSSLDDFEICQRYHGKSVKVVLSKLAEMDSFRRITFAEATEILEKQAISSLTLQTEHYERLERSVVTYQKAKHFGKASERYLVQHFGNEPVFVVDYPSDIKPFYMKRSRRNNTARCFDLLVPNVGELCGGSLRETDYATITERVKSLGIPDQLQWYTDLRKYGYANLGGFGLGFERLLQFLLGIENIKDCIAFPRWFRHCLT